MNSTILSEEEAKLFERLKVFYEEVRQLTINHDGLHCGNDNDYAVVYPSELEECLEKVNPNWYDET